MRALIYFALNFNRRDNLECFMGEFGPAQERLCKGDYLLKMGKEVGSITRGQLGSVRRGRELKQLQ